MNPTLHLSERQSVAIRTILLLFTSSFLFGQSILPAEKAPLPTGPILATEPDFFSWVIEEKHESPAEKSATGTTPQPSRGGKTIYAKTKNVCHIVYEDSSGNLKTIWSINNNLVVTRAEWSQPIVIENSNDSLSYSNLNAIDLDIPDLSWVAPAHYLGQARIGGQLCLAFKKSTSIDDSLAGTIFISLETHLPVLFQGKNVTYNYQYPAPPTNLLTPPPAIQTLLTNLELKKKATYRAQARQD